MFQLLQNYVELQRVQHKKYQKHTLTNNEHGSANNYKMVKPLQKQSYNYTEGTYVLTKHTKKNSFNPKNNLRWLTFPDFSFKGTYGTFNNKTR